MAWYHARLIRQHRPIKHGLWAGGYLVAVGMVWAALGILQAPALILIRAVFFDPALNLFRRLPISYQSTKTTSVIDKLANRFIPGFWKQKLVAGFGLVVSEILLIVLS